MIIEMMGTPGAGKTTLRAQLVQNMKDVGIQANTMHDFAVTYTAATFWGRLTRILVPRSKQSTAHWRIYLIHNRIAQLGFAVQHPILVAKVLIHQWRRPKAALVRSRLSIRRFLQLTGAHRWVTRRAPKDHVVLFDEGFVQRSVLLFASDVETPPYQYVREYLMSIPLPDLLIYPKSSLRTCIAQVFKRGVWGPFRGKSYDEICRFIRHASEVIEFAAEVMRERSVPIIEVENNDLSSLDLHEIFSNGHSAAHSSISEEVAA